MLIKKSSKKMCEVQRYRDQSTKEEFFINEKFFCINACLR